MVRRAKRYSSEILIGITMEETMARTTQGRECMDCKHFDIAYGLRPFCYLKEEETIFVFTCDKWENWIGKAGICGRGIGDMIKGRDLDNDTRKTS